MLTVQKSKYAQRFIIAIFASTFLISALSSSIARAQTEKSPLTALQTTTEKAQKTVKTEKGVISGQELERKLTEIIAPMFDFEEMAKSSLAQQWSTLNDKDRNEYVDLFSKLLSRTYLARIRDGIENSTITYKKEKIKGDRAIVDTIVTSKNDNIAVTYRLRLGGTGWRIYDVVIENTGLVSNYRTQFSDALRRDGMNGLLSSLRQKVKENNDRQQG